MLSTCNRTEVYARATLFHPAVQDVRDYLAAHASVDADDLWYCEACGAKLYEEFVPVTNIVTQLPGIFQRFYGDEAKRTCPACGTRFPDPK